MVAALELRHRGLPVHLLEASARLGGKAGADKAKHNPSVYQDHGYHIFPAWYVNTRRLLRELGINRHLIDFDRVYYLKSEPPNRPRWCALREPTPANVLPNIFSGLKPWYVTALAVYAGLDLATESLNETVLLDRTSANGYLRSRWYATEDVAIANHQFVLQASSIASYHLAAMTASKVLASYLKSPSPFLSVLDRDLQSGFIQPLEKAVREAGVTIEFDRPVKELLIQGERVTGLRFADKTEFAAREDDFYILATPFEVTYGFVDVRVVTAEEAVEQAVKEANPERLLDEKRLSDLVHLVRAPMAAFHVYCKRKLDGIPREHVVLHGSRYELSFIDVSQTWAGHQGGSVLSGIASAYAPLGPLSEEAAKTELMRELLRYLPEIEPEIDWIDLTPHLDAQLFLNTVGSFPYRPRTKTRLKNLFVASDYCRTNVELTTMESAVESGLLTAGHLLRALGIQGATEPLPIPKFKRGLMRWLFYALTPLIFLVWLISLIANASGRNSGGPKSKPVAPAERDRVDVVVGASAHAYRSGGRRTAEEGRTEVDTGVFEASVKEADIEQDAVRRHVAHAETHPN
jgi:hypothetical protein